MSQIKVSHLTFSYEGSFDTIFDNVSLSLDTDWKLGFVGRNGRGKTTFLKLLMNQLEYRGTISSPVPFDYFPFSVPDPALPAWEAAERCRPGVERWRVERELRLLRVDPDEVLSRPYQTLSPGEQTKLLLALLFSQEGAFLLIDEPTNHLDQAGRAVVSRYLNQKSGFILVSHDRSFLDGCVDHILSINRTNLEIIQGNYSTWQENKDRRDRFECAENEKLKEEISRLKNSARQAASFSDAVEKTKKGSRNSGLRPDRGFIGHKAAKMMQRAKSAENRLERAAEEKSKLLKNLESAEDLKLSPLVHPKPVLLSVDALSICYGDHPVFANLSFELRQGERLCLRGKNGCGKSSLLKLIAGEDIPYTGRLALAPNLILSVVSQDASFLSGPLAAFSRDNRLDQPLFYAILRKLGFSRHQFEKNMEDFSGGQKKKVLLARSLCTPAHLYLWDEPLNFIDLLSRIQLENLLLMSKPTLLFVEHDQSFCDRVATRVLDL